MVLYVKVCYSIECLAGIEPWTFEQAYGEAVFIPAGCPHQVRNQKVIFSTFHVIT